MTRPTPQDDPHRAERQRIIRRATLTSLAFFVAAVLVGVLGSALIAWMLTAIGLPFRRTWMVISAIAVLVPLIGVGVEALRHRKDRPEK